MQDSVTPATTYNQVYDNYNYMIRYITKHFAYVRVMRTLNSWPAYAEAILPFTPIVSTRIAGNLLVATTLVGNADAVLDTSKKLIVHTSSYGAASTLDCFGYVYVS